MLHECYTDTEEDVHSPPTTFSHISSGSFSHEAGRYCQTTNDLPLSSLESNGGVFGSTRLATHRKQAVIVVEHKPSPLVHRVTFPSDQYPVAGRTSGEVSGMTSSLRNPNEPMAKTKQTAQHETLQHSDSHKLTNSLVSNSETIQDSVITKDSPPFSDTHLS